MFNESNPDSLILPARRRFLKQSCLGFGSVALASMLQEQRALGVSPVPYTNLMLPPNRGGYIEGVAVTFKDKTRAQYMTDTLFEYHKSSDICA